MTSLPRPPLLVVTDRSQLAGGAAALGTLAQTAFAAGCRWISLREKDLPPDEQVMLAHDMAVRAAAFGAHVMLHGSAQLAHESGLHGVHLPEAADAAAARRLLGGGALIGQSVHTPAQARDVDPASVDYVIAGPAYLTASKPGYGPALGEAGIAAMVNVSPVPVIAIGGIDDIMIGPVLAAGAAGVAVMGTVMRAARADAVIVGLLAKMRG